MTTPKHTPGPWDWDQGDAGYEYSAPYCTVTAQDGELIVAEVNDRFCQETGRANALLISAAPELLAFHDAWVENEVARATSSSALVYEKRQALIERHKAVHARFAKTESRQP